MVTGVDVRGEHRLVLAPQDTGDLGGHAAEDQALGVDDVPLSVDLDALGVYVGTETCSRKAGHGKAPN